MEEDPHDSMNSAMCIQAKTMNNGEAKTDGIIKPQYMVMER